MATSAESSAAAPVNWPAVVAWTLLATTAVLLSFGALVTTYDAAMAVPDWPGTFGHNMLLFPFAEWFWGPWDLFLEHGHRLLGATVGMLTLLLAAIVFSGRSSPTLRWLVAAAVVLVVVQGALGGLRVILDDKTVAKVHACTGPLFFAVATAIASIASRRGRGADRAADRPSHDPAREVAAPPPPSWALGAAVPTVLLVAAYLQLVAGAQLRHADATLAPTTFRWMVILHLLGAAAVTVLAALAVVAWQPHENRGSSVPVLVETAAGRSAVRFDMQQPAPLPGGFGSAGRVTLGAGDECVVVISTDDAKGNAHADAVMLVPAGR